jgi:hypothetical protein
MGQFKEEIFQFEVLMNSLPMSGFYTLSDPSSKEKLAQLRGLMREMDEYGLKVEQTRNDTKAKDVFFVAFEKEDWMYCGVEMVVLTTKTSTGDKNIRLSMSNTSRSNIQSIRNFGKKDYSKGMRA